jgi:hypothetical protein
VRAPLQNGAYYLDTNGETRSISWPKDGCDLLPDYAIGGTLHVVNNGKLVGACSHQLKDAKRTVLTVGRETTLSGQLFGQVTFMQSEGAFKAYAQGLPEYGSQPSASFALLSLSKRGLVLLAREQDEQAEAAREQDKPPQAEDDAREQEAQAEDEAASEQAEDEAASEQAEEAAREQAEAAREQAEAARSRVAARAMLGGDDNKDDDPTPGNGTKPLPGKGKKRPRGRPKLGHTWDYNLGRYIKTSDIDHEWAGGASVAAGASAAAPMNLG